MHMHTYLYMYICICISIIIYMYLNSGGKSPKAPRYGNLHGESDEQRMVCCSLFPADPPSSTTDWPKWWQISWSHVWSLGWRYTPSRVVNPQASNLSSRMLFIGIFLITGASETNGTRSVAVTGKDGTRTVFPTLCVLQDTPLSIGKTPFGWWKKSAVLPSARYFSVGDVIFVHPKTASMICRMRKWWERLGNSLGTLDYKELVRVKQCQNVNLLLLSKSSFTRARNSINLWSAQHPQELFAHWLCGPWRTSRVAQPSGKVQDKWTHVNSARFPIIHPLLVCLRMILRFPCWISSSIPPSSTSLAPSPEALENHIPGQALQRAEWLTTNFWVRWVGSTWYQFFHFLEVLIGVVYCCVFSNTFSRDPMAYGSRPYSANSLILLRLKVRPCSGSLLSPMFARVRALFCDSKFARVRVFDKILNGTTVAKQSNQHFCSASTPGPHRGGSKSFGEASGTTFSGSAGMTKTDPTGAIGFPWFPQCFWRFWPAPPSCWALAKGFYNQSHGLPSDQNQSVTKTFSRTIDSLTRGSHPRLKPQQIQKAQEVANGGCLSTSYCSKGSCQPLNTDNYLLASVQKKWFLIKTSIATHTRDLWAATKLHPTVPCQNWTAELWDPSSVRECGTSVSQIHLCCLPEQSFEISGEMAPSVTENFMP